LRLQRARQPGAGDDNLSVHFRGNNDRPKKQPKKIKLPNLCQRY